MIRCAWLAFVAALVFPHAPAAWAQDPAPSFTPTGTIVVYGWGDDWNLRTFADLQGDGFRLHGWIGGYGNYYREDGTLTLARCNPCLAGDTVAVVGEVDVSLGNEENGLPELIVGQTVGVWAQGPMDDEFPRSRVHLVPTGGLVTLPKVPPGKGKTHREFTITVPVRVELHIAVVSDFTHGSPVTEAYASNLATVTVNVNAFKDPVMRRWEYQVAFEEPYTYTLGATIKKKAPK